MRLSKEAKVKPDGGGSGYPHHKNKTDMTDYELEKLCESQTECGCKCMRCELFARYIKSQRG